MQYTLRNVPPEVDRKLRDYAHERRASLNEAALELLGSALGVRHGDEPLRSLADLSGSWADDPQFDAAMEAFESIDDELWA